MLDIDLGLYFWNSISTFNLIILLILSLHLRASTDLSVSIYIALQIECSQLAFD